MTLENLGWNSTWEENFSKFRSQGWQPGRVAVEDKHYYVVYTAAGELLSQISGKLMHTSPSNSELPKVGDWVVVSRLPNEPKAVIHHVLPRKTRLSRKFPGRNVEEQILATNIDLVFVVEAMDRTFNPRLLERYLVMVWESGAKPVVLLNKADVCDQIAEKITHAQSAAREAPVIAVSALTGFALDQLRPWIRPGITMVFIGPSGVGKSTLVNRIFGEEIQATTEVRERDAKGRHTTTRRELILLPQGGLLIDTPGMREFHVWRADEGLQDAFPEIEELATRCHFTDCTHTAEKRCAVLEALAAGQLAQQRYQNYQKLRQELAELQESHRRRGFREKRSQPRPKRQNY